MSVMLLWRSYFGIRLGSSEVMLKCDLGMEVCVILGHPTPTLIRSLADAPPTAVSVVMVAERLVIVSLALVSVLFVLLALVSVVTVWVSVLVDTVEVSTVEVRKIFAK